MIRNDTKQPFQLRVRVGPTHLEGSWYSDNSANNRYQVIERDHRMTHEYWGGYSRHNVIKREVYDLEGNLLREEYVTENHALMMYAPFLD